MENYDENKLMLSSEQAKDFEERATIAGLTIAEGRRRSIRSDN
jgi:hypothetical protein